MARSLTPLNKSLTLTRYDKHGIVGTKGLLHVNNKFIAYTLEAFDPSMSGSYAVRYAEEIDNDSANSGYRTIVAHREEVDLVFLKDLSKRSNRRNTIALSISSEFNSVEKSETAYKRFAAALLLEENETVEMAIYD